MVKKLLLLPLFMTSLFAGEVMDLYRSGGMNAIAKEIDHGLGDSSFWNSKILNKDLKFGYYEATDTLLVCEKDQPTLSLYRKENKGKQERFALLKTIPAFTGKYDGDKLSAGDRRTPIGIYSLTQKLLTVDPFYCR